MNSPPSTHSPIYYEPMEDDNESQVDTIEEAKSSLNSGIEAEMELSKSAENSVDGSNESSSIDLDKNKKVQSGNNSSNEEEVEEITSIFSSDNDSNIIREVLVDDQRLTQQSAAIEQSGETEVQQPIHTTIIDLYDSISSGEEVADMVMEENAIAAADEVEDDMSIQSKEEEKEVNEEKKEMEIEERPVIINQLVVNELIVTQPIATTAHMGDNDILTAVQPTDTKELAIEEFTSCIESNTAIEYPDDAAHVNESKPEPDNVEPEPVVVQPMVVVDPVSVAPVIIDPPVITSSSAKKKGKRPAAVPIDTPSRGSHFKFTFRPPQPKPVPLPPANIKAKIFTKPVTHTEKIKVKTYNGDSYYVQRRSSFWGGNDVGPGNKRSSKHSKSEFHTVGPDRTKRLKFE